MPGEGTDIMVLALPPTYNCQAMPDLQKLLSLQGLAGGKIPKRGGHSDVRNDIMFIF